MPTAQPMITVLSRRKTRPKVHFRKGEACILPGLAGMNPAPKSRTRLRRKARDQGCCSHKRDQDGPPVIAYVHLCRKTSPKGDEGQGSLLTSPTALSRKDSPKKAKAYPMVA